LSIQTANFAITMKTTALILAATAALAGAQVTEYVTLRSPALTSLTSNLARRSRLPSAVSHSGNPRRWLTIPRNNGTFTCAKPNAAYCAGSSLGTDIIIRCDASGRGQPGRCSNNLVGQPPQGTFPALCWQSSETAGDAACEKNCVVYASLAASAFTLPSSTCTPYFTASSSSAQPTTTITFVNPDSTSKPPTTTITFVNPSSSKPPTTTITYVNPSGTGKPPSPPPSSTDASSSTFVTRTPVGPTRSPTTVPTAGAAVHQVGAALALVGLAAAYLI
jgi:hypothetical protein